MYKEISFSRVPNPIGIYMLKINNKNTRRCEICSKLTIKTPGDFSVFSKGWSRTSMLKEDNLMMFLHEKMIFASLHHVTFFTSLRDDVSSILENPRHFTWFWPNSPSCSSSCSIARPKWYTQCKNKIAKMNTVFAKYATWNVNPPSFTIYGPCFSRRTNIILNFYFLRFCDR